MFLAKLLSRLLHPIFIPTITLSIISIKFVNIIILSNNKEVPIFPPGWKILNFSLEKFHKYKLKKISLNQFRLDMISKINKQKNLKLDIYNSINNKILEN